MRLSFTSVCSGNFFKLSLGDCESTKKEQAPGDDLSLVESKVDDLA